MKWLVIVVGVLAALWGGWWFVGSNATEQAVTRGIEMARAQGWYVENTDVSVSGFPNRFDVGFTDLEVRSPTRWTVEAPYFQAFALSYRPNHVIAVAPQEFTVTPPFQAPLDVTVDDLRASLVVTASTQPVLDRTIVAVENMNVAGDTSISVHSGQMSMRQAGGANLFDVTLGIADLTIAGESPILPLTIPAIIADAFVTLDRPIGGAGEARLDTIEIRSGVITFEDTVIEVSGQMSVRANGQPQGDLMLGIEGASALVDRLVRAGIVPSNQAVLLKAGVQSMETDGKAQVPLTLANGVVSVLGLPVAPLPRLPVPGR